MTYIQGANRHQTYFTTLEEEVAADNSVRLTDAFVDKLDQQELGFNLTKLKAEGRPPFALAVLLKLYLYGYLNKIHEPFAFVGHSINLVHVTIYRLPRLGVSDPPINIW